jgi:DNA end-binding protein Ku
MTKPSAPRRGPEMPSAASGPHAAPPRGRASWTGLLQLSLVAVPVKAYPATSTSDAVHFNQLHANCGQRITYQKCCPLHGPVEATAIARGYQYVPGQYVVVEPEELEPLRPAKEKALLLEQFLEAGQLDPVFFSGRSLYLLPDGLAAQRSYLLLAEAMQERCRWGLGRVTLSANRKVVLVRPVGRLLTMDVLHYPAELRSRAGMESELASVPSSQEELRLAGQLIESASTPVDWQQYRDDTAEKIRALVEAKIAGRPVQAPAQDAPQVLQLLDALKQSVAATGSGASTTRKASRRRSA